MQIGDKVLVPRTGGGETEGEVIEVYTEHARVRFPIGDLYRGKPAPEQFRDAMGHKTIKITELKPIKGGGKTVKNNWREKTVLSVPEAAQVLGISRCLAYELVKTGDIPAIRLGGRRIIVPTESLTKILKQTESEAKNEED